MNHNQTAVENTTLKKDTLTVWLNANTAPCSRMNARITLASCRDNQQQSKFDNRCTGCRGLFDQTEPITPAELPLVFWETPQPPQKEAAWIDDIDRLNDDDLDELLGGYFFEEETEQQKQKRPEPFYINDLPDTRGRRVRVYIGCCVRCGGYMVNTVERYDDIKDDDVYRCFICGWRTSPGYEINRACGAV